MQDAVNGAAWHFTEIHHLGLTVADIERSVRFYRDVLGLTLVRRRSTDAEYIARQTGYSGARLEIASFRVRPGSGLSLELVQYVSHPGPAGEPGTNRAGAAHVCLQVDDIRAAYEALRQRGACFKTPPVEITSGPNQGGLGVYLLDPDGFTIELFQPPRDPAYPHDGEEIIATANCRPQPVTPSGLATD
jgi:catechol 2,3-dioxygenase-like lactoylglutathione lyase family enzyme